MGKFNNNKDFDTSLTLVNLTLVNHVHVQPLGDDGEHGRGRQDRGRSCRGGGREVTAATLGGTLATIEGDGTVVFITTEEEAAVAAAPSWSTRRNQHALAPCKV